VGFANAADTSFIHASAYIPIALGGMAMVGAVVHVLTTGKTAIIPRVRLSITYMLVVNAIWAWYIAVERGRLMDSAC
jgi:hypothetical protein